MSETQYTTNRIASMLTKLGSTSNAVDVSIKNQTTDAILFRMNKITNSTTVTSAISTFDREIVVASTTGVIAANPALGETGSYLIVFNNSLGRVMTAVVLAINGTTLTIDRPADCDFPIGSNVDITTVSMAIDGSSGDQVFGVRGPSLPTAVPVYVDINEIRLFCICDTAVDLLKFGDITRLTNGILLRVRSDCYSNKLIAKSNGEILASFGNWTPYTANNPAQGVDGFSAFLEFNGQNNHGVAIRLAPGEDLEFVFNEDLSGLVLLEAVAVGKFV